LNFGAAGQDGTVIWDANNGSISLPLPAINVEAGTLKGGNGQFGTFLDGAPISVASGATLDLTGYSAEFTQLTGGGSIIVAPPRLWVSTQRISQERSPAR
jgi:hypothetical protein